MYRQQARQTNQNIITTNNNDDNVIIKDVSTLADLRQCGGALNVASALGLAASESINLSYATVGYAVYAQNKKLSCRRETARCFLSLNISLTHSRSLKVIRMTPLCRAWCKSLYQLYINYI